MSMVSLFAALHPISDMQHDILPPDFHNYNEGYRLGLSIAAVDAYNSGYVKQAGLIDTLAELAAKAPEMAILTSVVAGSGAGAIYHTLNRASKVDDIDIEEKRLKAIMMEQTAKNVWRQMHDKAEMERRLKAKLLEG